MIRPFAALLTLLALAQPATAGDSAIATRQALETGAGAATLPAMQARGDDESLFGAAMLQFAQGLERYAQAQFRHGLQPPRGLALPFLRLPLPPNPAPEELTYEKQRATLQAFLDDLRAVDARLARMKGGEVKIPLDLDAISFDLTGAGGGQRVKLGQILAQIRMTPGGAQGEAFEVGFDRADALWLRGYANLLSALLQFGLAHDWRTSFETAAPLFYPRVSPDVFAGVRQSAEAGRAEFVGRRTDIADMIAFVHSIRWSVAEPERLKAAHGHLKQAFALSRESWAAILAETDDDREWIPSPAQKNAAIRALGPITQAQVDGWRAALDEMEAVLDGRKLMPHWRFATGFNLKRLFFEPRPFDVVGIATGHALAPYVEQGEAISWDTWNSWQRVFGGNFLSYAAWFN